MQFTLEMDMPNEQGTTQRQSLQQVINSTPQDSTPHLSAKAQLDGEPERPYCLDHVWHWFWELNSGRKKSEPLSYSEIKAWDGLKNAQIRSEEVDVIKHLDSMYLNYLTKKQRQQAKKKPGKKK